MRKLVAAAICLLSLSLSVTTGRRCIKEERTRTGKNCCEQQLRRVDKALSRAGDIPEGSWIFLSHRNLILAEDKRCSCPSSWGHSKILSKRPIAGRLYVVFDEVGRYSVTEYMSPDINFTVFHYVRKIFTFRIYDDFTINNLFRELARLAGR